MSSPVGFRIYLITDGWDEHTRARVEAALSALPRGLAAVQLRAKSLSARALYHAALELREVTRAAGAPLFVNDRIDLALAAGADGVHLPARGLPARPARRAAGAQLMIGASCHSLDEANMQVRGGADFVTFGPVWPTPSKAAFGAPLGPERLAEAVIALSVPVFALGGVDVARAREAVALGARVACIGAALGAPDPAAGARALASAVGS